MDKASMQDRHLDLLIQLAFAQMEDEELDKLIQSADPSLSREEEERMEKSYQRAIQDAKRSCRREKHVGHYSRRKKVIRAAGAGMAAALIIALIALPVAFAVSASFRASVMKLFVEIDNEANEARFSFGVDNYNQEQDEKVLNKFMIDSNTEVPEEWLGDYYPTYIPRDMEIDFLSSGGLDAIDFVHEDQKISFCILNENAGLTAGTEGAVINNELLKNGAEAIVIEGDGLGSHVVSITWALDDVWFDLITYNLSREETKKIAESVIKIK